MLLAYALLSVQKEGQLWKERHQVINKPVASLRIHSA